MNRRDFFKFLPVMPMVVAGDAIAMAHEGNEPNIEAIRLVLHGNKRKDGEMMRLSHHEEDILRSASLSVGEDGHLWVKTNNKWQRVVTE